MNEEQNKAAGGLETGGASAPATTETDLRSPNNAAADEAGTPKEEYDAVDHVKKDVLSTIGDGEMHNEGLAGGEDSAADVRTSADDLTDEQEGAERYDREA